MFNEEKAREDLTDILNGREYKAYEEKPTIFEMWWESIKEKFNELLSNLFPSIEIPENFSSTVLLIIIIVTSVLLLLLVAFITRRRNRNRAFYTNKPLQSVDELEWSYEMHLSEANKLEKQKEYKLATRHMFLALLLYFHEKEWLVARIWKTNWEYYEELKSVHSKWAQQFYRLALIFDEATYGDKVVNQLEYEQFKQDVVKWLSDGQDTMKSSNP